MPSLSPKQPDSKQAPEPVLQSVLLQIIGNDMPVRLTIGETEALPYDDEDRRFSFDGMRMEGAMVKLIFDGGKRGVAVHCSRLACCYGLNQESLPLNGDEIRDAAAIQHHLNQMGDAPDDWKARLAGHLKRADTHDQRDDINLGVLDCEERDRKAREEADAAREAISEPVLAETGDAEKPSAAFLAEKVAAGAV